jgi:hypothetical protein
MGLSTEKVYEVILEGNLSDKVRQYRIDRLAEAICDAEIGGKCELTGASLAHYRIMAEAALHCVQEMGYVRLIERRGPAIEIVADVPR